MRIIRTEYAWKYENIHDNKLAFVKTNWIVFYKPSFVDIMIAC